MIALVGLLWAETLQEAFPPPPGAQRVPVQADDFGAWLRQLPLYPPDREVHSYRGDLLDMPAARVVEMDVGTRDLQQCADSILRLRATWERLQGRMPAYHYTSGYLSSWESWAGGARPRVSGSTVTTQKGAAAADHSDASFVRWLTDLYMYAGTRSLPLDSVADQQVDPGDFLVTPGSPGHAVLVLDVAEGGGGRWVLVGQGYMPAMDFHVVQGETQGWFLVQGEVLNTAPIPMPWSGLRRWPS
ncbi:MAG TPA: DUF4846 domain-containing protein [Myxococcota bacterium]|nr:DUF4846 domain-containing protein [Myxococcota bacterium]